MSVELKILKGAFQIRNEFRYTQIECRVISDERRGTVMLHHGDIYITVKLSDIEKLINKAKKS